MTEANTLTIDTDALKDALAWIAKALPKTAPFPELGGIIARIEPGQVTLQGRDSRTACEAIIEAQTGHTDTLLLHGQTLIDLAKNMPADDARFTITDSGVDVRSGPSRARLTRMAARQHPGIPGDTMPQGHVEGADFGAALLRVAVAAEAASGQSGTETLKGIHLRTSDGQLHLTATDRYRAIIETIDWQPAVEGAAIEALVPGSVLSSFARAIQGAGAIGLSISDRSETLDLAIGARRATLPLMSETYPEVARLMDTPAPVRATVDTRQLRDGLRRMVAFSSTATVLQVNVTDDQIHLSVSDEREQVAEESMPAELDGEPFESRFTPRYLLDVIAGVTAPRLVLQSAGAVKPMRVEPVSDAGELLSNYRAIVMPRKY